MHTPCYQYDLGILEEVLPGIFSGYVKYLFGAEEYAAAGNALNTVAFSVVTWVIVLAAVTFFLVLVAVEAVLSLTLRFAGFGASGIGVIYRLHMVFLVLAVAFEAFYLYRLDAYAKKMNVKSWAANIEKSWLIVACVVIILILIMNLCYHSDVAKTMRTVGIETGSPEPDPGFRRTRLAGLSIVRGIPFICLGLYVIALLATGESMERPSDMFGVAAWIVLWADALKPFLISFCYRNLIRAGAR